jgi:peptide methionine sulfoxide reductase msrA/msrB
MKKISFINIFLLVLLSCSEGKQSHIDPRNKDIEGMETATVAGGCFWCIEAPFENIHGVISVVSGYSGGHEPYPTYQEVSAGSTGHFEAVQIVYDPKIVSYSELLDLYWKQFDPTDPGGSFFDRGSQYKSAIFNHNNKQKSIAEKSRNELNESGKFEKPIVTEITKFKGFYPAEAYHQDYYKKQKVNYKNYRNGSGRNQFILSLWGNWKGNTFQ